MTVCVAAICADGSAVVAAADRMISTPDNQTTRTKVHYLTKQVVALIAGDVALHTELLNEVRTIVDASSEEPDVQTVKNIADAYGQAYTEAKRRMAERHYLSPLGLNSATFIQNQRLMNESIVTELTRELLSFPMSGCSAIFIGIDASAGYLRAHLYSVVNGRVACHNDTGFVAIGVGQYQAESSLMFAGHTPEISIDAGVYLTFAAKKRAEVAPGVGRETDVAVVSVKDGGAMTLFPNVVDHLTDIYLEAEANHTRTNTQAVIKCHEYIDTLRIPEVKAEPGSHEEVTFSGTPPRDNPSGQLVSGVRTATATSTSGVQHDAGTGGEKEG
ncbi:hypothetical protein LJR074_002195 [Acidovorax sp. LjRoot74]|uniref:hypothetical protein n=1 Tax=Acidovorax sp. LjRoot74 TaxID=3342337 RepID=UPI003ECD87EB